MIQGVIWSYDVEGDGIQRLKYIRDRYMWSGINPIKEVYSCHRSYVQFENGDRWRLASTSEYWRGIRANIAWVDTRINEDFFRTVILPTLVSFCGPRYYEFFYAKE